MIRSGVILFFPGCNVVFSLHSQVLIPLSFYQQGFCETERKINYRQLVNNHISIHLLLCCGPWTLSFHNVHMEHFSITPCKWWWKLQCKWCRKSLITKVISPVCVRLADTSSSLRVNCSIDCKSWPQRLSWTHKQPWALAGPPIFCTVRTLRPTKVI